MAHITVRFLVCDALASNFAGTALAQSAPAPIGTWKGTFTGSDTGTLTITIDAQRNVTLDAFSTFYNKAIALTGSLNYDGYGGYGFQLMSPSPYSFPIWIFASSDSLKGGYEGTITGLWVSESGPGSGEGSGDFTANFVSDPSDRWSRSRALERLREWQLV